MSKVLDNHPMWLAALAVATDAHDSASSLPEDERWGMVSKMRYSALEVASDAAAAVGALDPRDVKLHLGRLREQAYVLKGMYVYAHKCETMKIDPEKVVKVENLIAEIDKQLQDIPHQMEQWYAAQEPPVQKRSAA